MRVYQICAASVDGNLRTFDIRKGEIKTDCVYHPVTCVCFSKDGNCLLATCMDSKVCDPLLPLILVFLCEQAALDEELRLNQVQRLYTSLI